MSDPQELLTLVDAAIRARLEGGAYDEYAEGNYRFKGMDLAQLRAFRAELIAEVAANEGGTFTRLVPLDEGGGCV